MINDLDIIVRSVVSIIVLFTLTRLMGKKHISNLSFFDYVVGISIGSIASQFAVDESVPYLHGIIALCVYTLAPVLVARISLKSVGFRRMFEATPTVLIEKGNFVECNLKKCHFTINDLLEEARLQRIFKVCDIDYAILETSGKVSFLLKPEKDSVTKEDLSLEVVYQGIEAEVILDGLVMYKHLDIINRDETWLFNELAKLGIEAPKNVFFCICKRGRRVKCF